MSRTEALRRARELREELRETQEVFTQNDFHERLLERCADLSDVALDGLVAWAAEAVDKRATRERHKEDPEQPIFPGFELSGDLKLGGGERIGTKYARVEHLEAALSLASANAENVQRALAAQQQELETLRPYLGPGVPKYRAVELFFAANPEAQGA